MCIQLETKFTVDLASKAHITSLYETRLVWLECDSFHDNIAMDIFLHIHNAWKLVSLGRLLK